jgi:gas vesicle protein
MVARTKKHDAAQKKKKPTNKKRLYEAAEHMEESREKFVAEMLRVLEVIESFNQRLRKFEAVLDNRDELIASRLEFTHTVMDSLTRLMDVLRDNSEALNQNSVRLNESIKKMESYFGDGAGPELEN